MPFADLVQGSVPAVHSMGTGGTFTASNIFLLQNCFMGAASCLDGYGLTVFALGSAYGVAAVTTEAEMPSPIDRSQTVSRLITPFMATGHTPTLRGHKPDSHTKASKEVEVGLPSPDGSRTNAVHGKTFMCSAYGTAEAVDSPLWCHKTDLGSLSSSPLAGQAVFKATAISDTCFLLADFHVAISTAPVMAVYGHGYVYMGRLADGTYVNESRSHYRRSPTISTVSLLNGRSSTKEHG